MHALTRRLSGASLPETLPPPAQNPGQSHCVGSKVASPHDKKQQLTAKCVGVVRRVVGGGSECIRYYGITAVHLERDLIEIHMAY